MIKYIKGDLIKLAQKGKFDIIAHGCNCFCTMGAGIAIACYSDGSIFKKLSVVS